MRQQMASAESVGNRPSLGLQLLGEHITAEGDTAFESHGGEISTLAALRLRPSAQRRNDPGDGGACKAQEVEIGSNGLNSATIFRTVRTKLQELNNPRKILSRGRAANSGNVLDLRGKRMLDRRGNQGTAVGHEELQQEIRPSKRE